MWNELALPHPFTKTGVRKVNGYVFVCWGNDCASFYDFYILFLEFFRECGIFCFSIY